MYNSWRHLLQEFFKNFDQWNLIAFLQFPLEKRDGFGIISEFFKNVAAVCCSDKVTTEKVDEHQRKCFIWKFNCHFSQELKLHPFVTLKEKVRFTHMQYASSNMQKSCCHANRQNDLKLLHRYMKLQNNKLLFMLGRDRAALFQKCEAKLVMYITRGELSQLCNLLYLKVAWWPRSILPTSQREGAIAQFVALTVACSALTTGWEDRLVFSFWGENTFSHKINLWDKAS